jgi:ElaB/YqjD/DUF883 family membrane-anchored ribosome-binding protein
MMELTSASATAAQHNATGIPGQNSGSKPGPLNVEQVGSAAHRGIDAAAGAVQPAIQRLAAGAHDAVDRIASAATGAGESIDQGTGQLRAASGRITDGCRSYVSQNPFAAVGVALAAGFVLSRLLRSR